MKKAKVLDAIHQLPDEFNLEDLVERLLFIEKVEAGINEAKEGKTISLKEARDRYNQKWQAEK
jgi:hypothetical protein